MIDEFEFLAEDGEVSQSYAEKGWGTWMKLKIHLSVPRRNIQRFLREKFNSISL